MVEGQHHHTGCDVGTVPHLGGRSELFQHCCQRLHAVEHGLLVGIGITKEQPSAGQWFQAAFKNGSDLNAHLRGQFGDVLIIFLGRGPADEMHPGLRGVHLQQAAQVGMQFAVQQIAKLPVMVEHLAQMPDRMPLVHKVEERHLFQQGMYPSIKHRLVSSSVGATRQPRRRGGKSTLLKVLIGAK
jgi:hypothetical protein